MTRKTLSLKRSQEEIEDQEAAELLNDPRFRNFVWRVIGKAGIYQSTYSGAPHATSYREGFRALGLEVLRMLVTARSDAMVVLLADAPDLRLGTTQHKNPSPGGADDRYADDPDS